MERISIQEDFVFGSVMSNKHLCQHLIQIILPELRINRIEFPTLQKAVQENIISREFVSMSIPRTRMVWCMKLTCRSATSGDYPSGCDTIRAGLMVICCGMGSRTLSCGSLT